jgi:transcriptional regulator with XRE-family HTH domain
MGTISKIVELKGGSEFARRVGQTIRQARLRVGLTQKQLASPLTGAFVSRVEHGRIVPSLPALVLLVGRLDLSMDEFFRLVGSPGASAAGVAAGGAANGRGSA